MANFNGELFRLFAAMPPPRAAKAGRRPVYVFLAFRHAGFNTAGSAGINFTTQFPPPKSPLRAASNYETGRIGLQNRPFWNAKRPVSGAKTARFERRFPSKKTCFGPVSGQKTRAFHCTVWHTRHIYSLKPTTYRCTPILALFAQSRRPRAGYADYGGSAGRIFNTPPPCRHAAASPEKPRHSQLIGLQPQKNTRPDA